MITNISCYQFARLDGLKPLRERLLAQSKAAELKGTILLSTEGINLFVAGPRAAVDALVAEIRRIPGLQGLAPKYSESETQPFNRMLVRIKKEIIAFGVEGIDPSVRTSPKLPARVLKQWLDEGRPITLLDTRNDYEVKLGTFRGAKTLGIGHFRDFPAATRKLEPELRDQPVVMFCTGGIRCEKAGPFMEREGFREIYQLDGGILKYFEECGGAHYEGECFVFDQRVGVDPSLHETESTQCYACLTPLSAEDQRDARYQPPHACPYCRKTSIEHMAERIAARHEALSKATHPLQGSRPYENRRPINVPGECDGWMLLDMLAHLFPHVAREEWAETLGKGRFVNDAGATIPAGQRVRAGERVLLRLPETVEPDVAVNIRILHEDEAIVVLDKPAPLPMHAAGRYNRNTLQAFLATAYAPENLRPAHRLDANTSGVVIFTRTRRVAGLLQPQFMRGEVKKSYLARVNGHPAADVFQCDSAISSSAGAIGSRTIDEAAGLPALTEFQVMERLSDDTTLLEARPVTGRTNQIRIHLWQLGIPVLGDPTYLPEQRFGDTQTLAPGQPPMCLHAWKAGFTHPISGEAMAFEAAAPAWAAGTRDPRPLA